MCTIFIFYANWHNFIRDNNKYTASVSNLYATLKIFAKILQRFAEFYRLIFINDILRLPKYVSVFSEYLFGQFSLSYWNISISESNSRQPVWKFATKNTNKNLKATPIIELMIVTLIHCIMPVIIDHTIAVSKAIHVMNLLYFYFFFRFTNKWTENRVEIRKNENRAWKREEFACRGIWQRHKRYPNDDNVWKFFRVAFIYG